MLCHKDVGLWIDLGYIMRVENSANSIVQVSHDIGKALQQKESEQVKKYPGSESPSLLMSGLLLLMGVWVGGR